MLEGKWIRPETDMRDVCPVFRRTWDRKGKMKRAELLLTAQGVYEAVLNGKKVGDGVLAPGWTSYRKRLQYQTYDISELLEESNELLVTVGKGWFRSPMPGFVENPDKEWRKEQERVEAKGVFVTPAGEVVVDFGQEITGYVEFTVEANAGDKIRILHGEVLDAEGNFYRENYRGAKAEINYICRQGRQTWHPVHTFFGFRYLKLEAFPGEAKPEQFTAIAVYSDLRRTGSIQCSDPVPFPMSFRTGLRMEPQAPAGAMRLRSVRGRSISPMEIRRF